jgi:membrane protein DedA with SNARE-associated domain
MSEKILADIAAFIIAVISASGYAGVALLMAIESACIPLPSEIIMPFAGYLVHTGRLNLFWVATAGAIGCNLGSAVAYWIGALGGRPFFARYGSITVFLARLLPIVRTFIALPAGIAKMPQLRFHLYTFIGSWPWCLALAWAGARLGQAWDSDPRFKAAFHRLHLGMELILLAAFLWFLWTHWRNRVRPDQLSS